MTFKEALELAEPDSKTTQQNVDFLEKEVQPKLNKEMQAKIKGVLDSLKQQQLAKKSQEEQTKQQKEIEQTKKPIGDVENTAQVSKTVGTAQVSNTNKTAQFGNTSILTKFKK